MRHPQRLSLLALVPIAALALPSVAGAQDFNLAPRFGEVTLNSGFEPDPHELALTAGGAKVDASLGDSACWGYVTSAPSYRVQYTAGSFPLVISAEADSDTTLIINNPNGEWLCDDDSGGDANPLVTIDAPVSGQYDIWVGSYSSAASFPATLRLSEFAQTEPVGALPDTSLSPTYGSADLVSGFEPDPRLVAVTAGAGTIEAYNVDGTGSCAGYVHSAPDYRITYTPGSYPLIFVVDSNDDTTLVVNDPNGAWFCDDDSGADLNPVVRFDAPLAGQYDVWVGTFSQSSTVAATLHITELEPATDDMGALGTEPDTSLPPTYGEVDLSNGFVPDPHTVTVTAGNGQIDPSGLTTGDDSYCAGYIQSAPDFSVNYTAGSYPLTFQVTSSGDTTLVVNNPDGSWFCNDDSDGLNPAVNFDSPASGRYDVWVGTYSTTESLEATLNVTEVAGQ